MLSLSLSAAILSLLPPLAPDMRLRARFPAGLRSELLRWGFVEEIEAVEEFLRDPWLVRLDGVGEAVATMQVLVPKVGLGPALYGDVDGGDAYSASVHVTARCISGC